MPTSILYNFYAERIADRAFFSALGSALVGYSPLSAQSKPTIVYIQVALPVPLPRLFSYLPLPDQPLPEPGTRVRVPFGRQSQVGIVVSHGPEPELDPAKIKTIEACLDDHTLFSPALWKLAQTASRYYFTPLGLVLPQMIPVRLRKGESADPAAVTLWQLTDSGREVTLDSLKRAAQQQRIIAYLQAGKRLEDGKVTELEFSRQALKALTEKGLLAPHTEQPEPTQSWDRNWSGGEEPPRLNPEQAIAVSAINQHEGFGCFLLDGVTGSGKTEVYLSVMKEVLRRGQSVLVLVPEIGLTPQTIARFRRRFPLPMEVLHSAVNDTERLASWQRARAGGAAIVLGTRSALFTPLPELGLIVIDEEHDASFKQQEGFRYHGRDLAVMRAQLENVPIVLGSATPALETLNNVQQGRYRHLPLTRRAGAGQPVRQILQDIRHLPLDAGLSPPLIQRIRQHLDEGNQVMLFLNRRGFAPALLCHECGHLHECNRCDAFYTVHQASNMVQCHHCGSQKRLPRQCPDCGSTQLFTRGVGTEQLEQALERLFPDAPAVRIDRDSTSRKGSLEAMLERIRSGEVKILVGTQMLAKGHHFPDVTLVGLLDVDSALFSADFRASERLAQLYTQVAGRSGRASKKGEVVLQTHQPEHPLLHQLLGAGYAAFAKDALTERQQAQLPPYWQLAVIRAEANQAHEAQGFLQQAKSLLPAGQVQMIGPMAAPLERKAGKYRFQALLLAPDRRSLQQSLEPWLVAVANLESGKRCRWHLERDPQDLL
ncbi:primosomal protein N' [Ferrimonas balearica]|uniref:primosomal protein N' n=1 Tax=Ferrimonas balearica TaxID=44012 RepID=UPI001F2DAB5A|nr:primosomal protein N' [Ferrimonas balearica]MBY6095780.1 primosomal protein N' [Ferrimonas balearica]